MDIATIGIIAGILGAVAAFLQFLLGNRPDWKRVRGLSIVQSSVEPMKISQNEPATKLLSDAASQIVMLPRQPQPFVNREAEIDRIKAELKLLHVVQLRGLGGIGKTALAIEIAYKLISSFSDGVVYISAIDHSTLEEIINAIAHAFDIPIGQAALPYKKTLIQKALQSKRLLLVFDNVEDFGPIESVLDVLPTCAALITSRPPYIMSKAILIEVGPMPHESAVRLFELNAGHSLSNEHKRIAGEICGRLGAFPLAIEMAAKQIQISKSNISNLALRIERATSLKELETKFTDDRSVHASFLSTYRQLSNSDKSLFASLGTFGGSSFSVEAIRVVSANERADEGLDRLVALSLAKVEYNRYSLHPLLKLFARENLTTVIPYKRMAQHYCDYAVMYSEDFAALEIERANLQEAINWSFNHGEMRLVIRTVQALLGEERDYGFLAQRGYWNDALVRTQQAIQASSQLGELEAEAHLYLARGLFDYWFGNYDESRAAYNTAHQRFTEIGNDRGLVRVYWQLGYLEDDQDNYAKAEELYRKSLSLALQIGDNRLIGTSRELVGVILYHRGRYDEARRELQDSLDECTSRGDKAAIARTKRRLASVARKMAASSTAVLVSGYVEEARGLLSASLEIEQNQRSIARLFRQFGLLEQFLCNYPEAKAYFNKSLDIFKTLGNKKGVAATLHNLGTVLEEERDWKAAERYYNESLAIGTEINMRSGTALNLLQLASVAYKRREFERADEFATQAAKVFADIQSPHLQMADSLLTAIRRDYSPKSRIPADPNS